MSEPREWWIKNGMAYEGTPEAYEVGSSFHVIEKSAYDALKGAISELKCSLEQANNHITKLECQLIDNGKEANAELDKQENELRSLRDEMSWTRAENSNLLEQNNSLTLMAEVQNELAEKYRKALNWIVNDASSFGLEAEPYVERAKAALGEK